MTRDTRLRDFETAYRTTKKVIKEHTFFHFFRESPRHNGGGLFCFYTLKDETIARNVDNEVVKKASTLTANGNPFQRGGVYLGAWLF